MFCLFQIFTQIWLSAIVEILTSNWFIANKKQIRKNISASKNKKTTSTKTNLTRFISSHTFSRFPITALTPFLWLSFIRAKSGCFRQLYWLTYHYYNNLHHIWYIIHIRISYLISFRACYKKKKQTKRTGTVTLRAVVNCKTFCFLTSKPLSPLSKY